MIENIESTSNSLATSTEHTRLSRRRFLSVSGRYGFNVAVLASIGGYLWSDTAVAQTSADGSKNSDIEAVSATDRQESSTRQLGVFRRRGERALDVLRVLDHGGLLVVLHFRVVLFRTPRGQMPPHPSCAFLPTLRC